MSSVQFIDTFQGVCLTPDSEKNIHFMRYHFVVSHEAKEYTFYLYEHLDTSYWFVQHRIFDQCLSRSGWSKTIHNAFKKQRSVRNRRGINQAHIDAYSIPIEAEEQIIEQIRIEK